MIGVRTEEDEEEKEEEVEDINNNYVAQNNCFGREKREGWKWKNKRNDYNNFKKRERNVNGRGYYERNDDNFSSNFYEINYNDVDETNDEIKINKDVVGNKSDELCKEIELNVEDLQNPIIYFKQKK
jgi:hypothetical protein